MHVKNILMSLALGLLLAACGGGGGDPGINTRPGTGSGSGSGDPTTPTTPTVILPPNLTMSLQDASGGATNSISASGYTVLSVKLADPSGNPIPSQVIEVTADATKVIFPESTTALTNASGIATIKLARASLVATGAGSLTAIYSYKAGALTNYPDGSTPPTVDTVIAKYLGYELSAANITLTNMDVGTTALAAYGTRPISIQANIDGAAATATPVQVSFSATCGQVSPATASTNSGGLVLVSYSATDAASATSSTRGCSGKTVEITASTVGASAVTKQLNIIGAPATNMSFVAANPARIYLADSGGATQSTVQFKLINAQGEGLLGQEVLLTLKTLNGGIPKASFGAVGSITAITLTTDANGVVSVPVFSGTVPTNVIVNAALVSNALVQTDSSVLSIASGRPAQSRVSLALSTFAIEGSSVDGALSTATLSLADRQGNPVPDGTAVNFVTEGGVMIPPICYTGGTRDPATGVYSAAGNSQCTVKIRSQNPRPANGRVSILAYAAGEEDFVDANFNNVYDCGEAFTDLGTAYRDDNENIIFDTGEFAVPRASSPSSCGAGVGPLPMTGDGVWGTADVRRQAVIIFSTSSALITGAFKAVVGGVRNGLDFVVQDLNGNSVATGSTVFVSAGDRTSSNSETCGLNNALVYTDGLIGLKYEVSNSMLPAAYSVGFKGCTAGDVINVQVTSPGGVVTSQELPLPSSGVLTTTAGNATTINRGQNQSYLIVGGVGPYTILSSDVAVADPSSVGSDGSFSIRGAAVGTAAITFTDSAGSSGLLTVTVQ